MACSPLRQRLKIETAEIHERLHHHDQFAATANGSIDSAAFDDLMDRMGTFYAALDPIMVAACRHTGADRAGYFYRPRAPLFPRALQCAPRFARIDNLASLAGAAYVVDGAVLGGQIIGRAIAGRLEHPYWEWCAEVGAMVWRQARGLIEHADRDPYASDRAVASAKHMFQAFADHMSYAADEVAI